MNSLKPKELGYNWLKTNKLDHKKTKNKGVGYNRFKTKEIDA